jgi:hypothetical protein
MRKVEPEGALSVDKNGSGGSFAKYKNGVEQADRAVVRDLLAIFHCGYENGKYVSGSGPFFDWGLGRIKNLKFTSEDVRAFSLLLSEFEHEADFGFRAQRVLNTLMHQGTEERYSICTSALKTRINALGHMNSKYLTIDGDVGDILGFEMRGGVITVNGNAGKYVGAKMRGGEIHINGEYESIGDGHSGKIYHKGNLIWPKRD